MDIILSSRGTVFPKCPWVPQLTSISENLLKNDLKTDNSVDFLLVTRILSPIWFKIKCTLPWISYCQPEETFFQNAHGPHSWPLSPRICIQMTWKLTILEICSLSHGFFHQFGSKLSVLCHGYHIAIQKNCFSKFPLGPKTDLYLQESVWKWLENDIFMRSVASHTVSFTNLVQK